MISTLDRPSFGRGTSAFVMSARIMACAFILWGAACFPAFADSARSGSRPPSSRLGTAAGPFGWAKVVGDLDKDGTPDVAVADHVTRHGGKTQYDLEVELSTGASEDFEFSSDEPALELELADVDGDGDLDIVLKPVFTRIAAAVWVNDGHGQFRERVFSSGAALVLPSGHVRVPAARGHESILALTVPARPLNPRWMRPAMQAPRLVLGSVVAQFSERRPQFFNRSSLASRAPPLPTR
jgi:hypothetical protein